MINKLAQILAAAGVCVVPKVGVDGDVHGEKWPSCVATFKLYPYCRSDLDMLKL
jgi:hypothetical protein